ncbi:lovastatin nonaketide synthase [Penicillium frequentans]|uniref:Lovastatin nonaketide synthase n=1 Tax=Penicillium frequentans TaxID=3151616 RepID=A0AAD6CQY7_9EURO|nr:lovastatin nonaketide synthase [Penicillium glabrum]
MSSVDGPNHAAIIGYACRVAGADRPSKLWDNIVEQRDLRQEMPSNRFNIENFYHPKGTNKGTTNAKHGYFLDQDLGVFDRSFFRISGKEAEAMDPQQRLLLEVVYEALEDAGLTLDEIDGSNTSVLCGSFTNDYNAMITKDLEYYPKYTVTGTGNAILANRVSYAFNLKGMSLTIDTACSSSLVSFHLGAQAIQNGECDMSIIVGSALHFDPNIFITMTDLGMLSEEGRCRAFDADGKGYARGDGICAVILRGQNQAQLHEDRIRAVVKATGSNHDGMTQGITLPSSEAQVALIQRTYHSCGLDPADTQYVEAHGTGTARGDPLEMRAIGTCFASKQRSQPLYVGSIKTNIGHAEGASGVAGLIKATMALEKGKIPPNMHFKRPNKEIAFDDWGITVPTDLIDFPTNSQGTKRVSINSFGYGGSNAHVILEAYDTFPNNIDQPVSTLPKAFEADVIGRPFLVPLTSHSEKAGKVWTDSLTAYLQEKPETLVSDLAYSLINRRTLHEKRSFVIGTSAGDVASKLENVPPWTRAKKEPLRLGFVFTGQGAQWHSMGRELIAKALIFRQTLERADRVLSGLPDGPNWLIVEELSRTKEESRLAETELSQPVCTAVQLALLELLKSWGVVPTACAGHSSGEVASAYAAGILSFDSAMCVAYYRGLHMSNKPLQPGKDEIPGAMLAVGLGEAEAALEIKAYPGRVVIAAVNSPSSVTLSGDEDAIIAVNEDLQARNVFARRLQVKQAFHSHHMSPLAPAYEKALVECPSFAVKPSETRMFSSVTGRVAKSEKMGPEYWAANMTGTVRFSDALIGILLDDMENENLDVLVEIGPHPALKGPSKQVMKSLNMDLPYLASLTRGAPDFEGMLALAGQLFQLGYPVDLSALNSDIYLTENNFARQVFSAQKLSDLPTYAWDHSERFWAETRIIHQHRLRPHRHSILGAIMPGSIDQHTRWRNYLRIRELPWLGDHVVDGKVVFPAAGYMSLAIEAAIRAKGTIGDFNGLALRDISIKAALVLDDSDMGTEVILDIRPQTTSAKSKSNTWLEFSIFSYAAGGETCTEHCTGLVSVENNAGSQMSREEHEQRQKQSTSCSSARGFYRHLHDLGLHYGADFQLLTGNIECGSGFASSTLTFNPEQYASQPADVTVLHPTMLDATFHTVFAALEGLVGRDLDVAFVPTFLQSLDILPEMIPIKDAKGPQEVWVASSAHFSGPRAAVSDLVVYNQDTGRALVSVAGLRLTSLSNGDDVNDRSLFFRTRWQPAFDQLMMSSSPALHQASLEHMLRLFVHQHPNTRMLHFTPDIKHTREIVHLLTDESNERRVLQSITAVASNTSFDDQFQDELAVLQKERPGFVLSEEPEEQSFDLVIVSNAKDQDVLPYIKDDGYILTNGCRIDHSNLKMVFDGQNFNVWQKNTETLCHQKPILLCLSPKPSRRTLDLASQFKAVNKQRSISSVSITKLPSRLSEDSDLVILASLDQDLFAEMNQEDELIFNATREVLTRPDMNVLWLLHGATSNVTSPMGALIIGLSRSARSENDSLRLLTLDLPDEWSHESVVPLIPQLLDPAIQEEEFSFRENLLSIPRVVNDDGLNSMVPGGVASGAKVEPFSSEHPIRLAIDQVGLLETLVWEEDPEIINEDLAGDDIEIDVRASAINFRDIAAAVGIIDDYMLGDECAGIVRRVGKDVDPANFQPGDRVVALRPGRGAHRSVVRNPACHCYRLGQIPFEQAAALPLILTTAYYSLVDTARLQPGETVLIHAAAGGVGQIAIQIAQMIGANIIATVGSPAKRDLLRSQYGLADEAILNSRDDSFVAGVMKLTGGRGVDVVLNSLAGKLLHASWNSLATFGRFVEIGKRDIHENSTIGMEPFRRNVSFSSVDLVTIYKQDRQLGARLLSHCCNLVHEGKIKLPETILTLPYSEAVKGFRMLQMGQHTGKVVLVANNDEVEVAVRPPTWNTSKNLLSPDKTYLIVGGLGGLGRTLVEWMMQRQAKSLAILSRSGEDREEAKSTVSWLRTRGVKVAVYKGDVADPTDVQNCISKIQNLGGVIQAAMVLADAPLQSMTYSQWHKCVQPKVHGAYNLHNATMGIPLDFFVCFSSISAFFGGKAQANYAGANACLDSLMGYRRQLGLPASTMNCGRITGHGVAAEDAALERFMEDQGYEGVNRQELLYQVENAIFSHIPSQVSSGGLDLYQTLTGVTLARDDVFWAKRSIFKNLYRNHDFNAQSGQRGAGGEISLLAVFKQVTDPQERFDLILERFVNKLSVLLGLSPESLKPADPVYGLDSLVAIELRNWFTKALGVDIALFDVLAAPSIRALVEKCVTLFGTQELKAPRSGPQNTSASSPQVSATPQDRASLNFPKADLSQPLPLSTFQTRLWFSHMLAADKSLLNLPIIMHLHGEPDHSILEKSLSELIFRNPILRTAYQEGEEYAEQRVMHDREFILKSQDVSQNEEATQALKPLVAALKMKQMKIEEGEVIDGTLVKISEDDFALVLIMHHICTDRSNTQSFITQLSAIYDTFHQRGNISTIPSPKLNYADFTLWHNDLLSTSSMSSEIEFWKNQLSGMPSSCELLPFAKSERPSWDDYGRATTTAEVNPSQLKRMKRICLQSKTSPFQFLFAAFRAFLYRYTADKDLTILMVDGNRPHADLSDVLGFFVNMTPIRCQNTCDGSFENLLLSTRDRILDSMSHSAVPFDVIVTETQQERSTGHFPLGQVMINYQQPDGQDIYQTKDFVIQKTEAQDMVSGCELNLRAREDPDNALQLQLEYSTTLYGDTDMQVFFENFETFLSSLIKDHRQPIDEVIMSGPREIERLANDFWHGSSGSHSREHPSLTRQILRVAEMQPNAIAITTSESQTITYGSLVDSARRLAFSLQSAGIGPRQRIGILATPGIDMVTAMLGVLFNRCGYVPMDSTMAVGRLAFITDDSGMDLLLFDEACSDLASEIRSQAQGRYDTMSIKKATSSQWPADLHQSLPGDPFYMMYTSGSTGTPKGVPLSQQNVHEMLAAMQEQFKFCPEDRFLHQISPSFDLSVVELWSSLAIGAKLCIASRGIRHDPVLLGEYMRQESVTVTYFTPTQFALVIEHNGAALTACPDYRIALLCGERLPSRLADAFYRLKCPAALYNAWGPTEAVVQTTLHPVRWPEDDIINIPIGKALGNCRHYIVDECMNPLPAGFIGEICIGGPQVATGYWNRLEVNRKQFVDNPFASTHDKDRGWTTVFRTGDLGRFLPNGDLEFLGRISGDKQIKLRGYRIDLGEIEHVLHRSASPDEAQGVVDLAVVAYSTGDDSSSLTDDRWLVAFIVPKQTMTTVVDKTKFATLLYSRAKSSLSHYMLPNVYQFIEKLPTTASGKTDRRALLGLDMDFIRPDLDGTASMNSSQKSSLHDGQAPAEQVSESTIKTVNQVWQEVLKLDTPVQPTANFFETGGSSILLLRLQSKLRAAMNVSLSLQDMIRGPTPIQLANLLHGRALGSTTSQEENTDHVDWVMETTLPNHIRYYPSASGVESAMTDILLTGADTFQGIHLLAHLLVQHPGVIIHVLGTHSPLDHARIFTLLLETKLINETLTGEQILTRVRVVPGYLGQESKFGLSPTEFENLGRSISTIYHLASEVSLLKTFHDLKHINTTSILSLVELSHFGGSDIHYLSTWSVPHLQSWSDTQSFLPSMNILEENAGHFTPQPTSQHGYFKSRWAAEMLLTRAADRGFPITIYRASSSTGNTSTGVASSQSDFVRGLILDMIRHNVIPKAGTTDHPFVVDFVPVNYLVDVLIRLSMQRRNAQEALSSTPDLQIFHITNPRPLPLNQLPALTGLIRGDDNPDQIGQHVSVDDWLAHSTQGNAGEDEQLRREVLGDYFRQGHNMFALDRSCTDAALAGVEDLAVCPSVDEAYLRALWKE